jgi:alpha-glucosidase
MKKLVSLLVIIVIAAVFALIWSKYLRPRALHFEFQNAAQEFLVIEFERQDVLHFEYGKGRPRSSHIATSPMVARPQFKRPLEVLQNGSSLKTKQVRVDVDTKTLCFSVKDRARGYSLGDFCPQGLQGPTKALTMMAPEMNAVYGLGERFQTPGVANGDWIGKVRDSGSDPKVRGTEFGNNMGPFNGAMVGNAQFPILYATGLKDHNFALFLDNTFKQRWDFTARMWKVDVSAGELRGYIFAGPDLSYLRSAYMELTGRPPVPPKKAFGLWISEYGFDNWAEMDDKVKTLRANNFPVDGLVMDLQWFGGITKESEDSAMGGLVWDRKNFPDPESKIKSYKEDGLGVVLIEESYISEGVKDPETGKTVHSILEEKGMLARDPGEEKKATRLSYNPWWGIGGMLDWSNPETGKYWHDWRRQALIDMGVTGHWTDLGEPELLDPKSVYNNSALSHADVHNLLNFYWAQSIFEGYQRHKVQARPWILSRSGTSGIQRFGVGMWSGDIGANLSDLAAQLNVQMNMSFSGIDYFGSDIGGFHRETLKGDLNEEYTQWFAEGAALDVPVRPHTENLCNCKETAPDRIGDKASNLFNIRQRYELNPYYYSLAHLAYSDGQAVIAPMALYYQEDPLVKGVADQKLIGRDLLVGLIAQPKAVARDIYLPKGVWINYHTHEKFESKGEWLRGVSAKDKAIFRLPLFAREGAIIPKAKIDEKGKVREDLGIRVYPSKSGSQFTLFEDDGETIAYQTGEVRKTLIEQSEAETSVSVTMHAAEGSYKGSKNFSRVWLEVATYRRPVMNVSVNGSNLPKLQSREEFEQKDIGWFDDGSGLALAKASEINRTQPNLWKFDF